MILIRTLGNEQHYFPFFLKYTKRFCNWPVNEHSDDETDKILDILIVNMASDLHISNWTSFNFRSKKGFKLTSFTRITGLIFSEI